jgi:AraC family transcriptional regulator
MTIIRQAIWFVEARRETGFALEDVAKATGVSRHHLARAFRAATGRPLIAYARSRRLTEAARRLAAGESDILGLALASGFGSHEAFTRAFRAEFGVTPEMVRRAGTTATLPLTETLPMDDSRPHLAPPRFVTRPAFTVAGLAERFEAATIGTIPTLWSRFAPWIGAVPGQVGTTGYGICLDDDGETFRYLAGVETMRPREVAPDLVTVALPAARYAVFTHRGHVSGLPATTRAIWSRWLPEHGVEPGPGPDFECYDSRFDPVTGNGVVEIWVPVAAA